MRVTCCEDISFRFDDDDDQTSLCLFVFFWKINSQAGNTFTSCPSQKTLRILECANFFVITFRQITSCFTFHCIFFLLFSWCRSRTEECHWQAGPVCRSEWSRVWKNDNGETEGQPKVLLPLWGRILQLLQVQACYGAAAAYVVKGTVHHKTTCTYDVWCWRVQFIWYSRSLGSFSIQ